VRQCTAFATGMAYGIVSDHDPAGAGQRFRGGA
jgi:hypothetical protein